MSERRRLSLSQPFKRKITELRVDKSRIFQANRNNPQLKPPQVPTLPQHRPPSWSSLPFSHKKPTPSHIRLHQTNLHPWKHTHQSPIRLLLPTTCLRGNDWARWEGNNPHQWYQQVPLVHQQDGIFLATCGKLHQTSCGVLEADARQQPWDKATLRLRDTHNSEQRLPQVIIWSNLRK